MISAKRGTWRVWVIEHSKTIKKGSRIERIDGLIGWRLEPTELMNQRSGRFGKVTGCLDRQERGCRGG